MSPDTAQFPKAFVAFTIVIAMLLVPNAFASKKIGVVDSGQDYYTSVTRPIFLPAPEVTDRKPWLVKNFGPVGIGIDLIRPGMTMRIHNVEADSPADKTGKLQKGQIIESINGTFLKNVDPRILLGDIITEAEAKDGKVVLEIQGAGDVTVNIPVMGAYSETWPLNCPKSDKIVRNLAEVLARDDQPSWGAVLFLLSTGDEKDLDVVKHWMKGIETIGGMNWEKGYKGPGLCEYYLRTGDQSVLPVIKKMTEELRVNMYSGGWSGRGAPAAFTYSVGTGQVHASGVNCMSFLLMAKLCGVEVDKYMFDQAFAQFYRFAGHGNVAYGNGLPEGGFRDNGKTAGLAFGLGAAAMVDPDGENSVYARARDNSAMKSFYATNWFHLAHTGGGMGEIWHHSAISQMREKRPAVYRSYLDTRRWVMDLSRRFDGSIGIAGMDDRYDKSVTEDKKDWGTYFALTYTFPRKHLQIFGAPRSKWAKSMPLPRPWGNAADDLFQSIEPIPGGPLTHEDLMNERVETDSSMAVIAKLTDPNLTDDTLLRYIQHPEYGLRSLAMDQVVRRGKVEMVVPLLKSEDPRLRHAGLLALTGMFKGSPLAAEQVTPEMYDLAGRMVENPDESWWVAKQAIEALGRARPDVIAKHRKRLLEFLKYDSTWLQTAAVCTLAKIATDPAYYKAVLPEIVHTSAGFRVDASSYQTTKAIANALKEATPEVKDFASSLMKQTYSSLPEALVEPNTGALMMGGARTIHARIGELLREVPGGEEFVRRLPKDTVASHISGKDSDMFVYGGKFEPIPELIGTWIWAVWPQPAKPSEIDSRLEAYLKSNGGKVPDVITNSKDTIRLEEGGKTGLSRIYNAYFWSGNMLIGMNDSQAVKMEIRKAGGSDFLIIEKNGFNAPPESDEVVEIPEDWHSGYNIYVRKK